MNTPCSRLPSRAPTQAGFSMLEIFIVIALIVILATMASPALKDMIGRYRLNAASREAIGYVKVARILAVTRHTYTRVMFTEIDGDGGLYRVEEWATSGGGGRQWQVVDDPLGRSSTMLGTTSCPAGITGSRTLEYCIDLKVRYPSVAIDSIDDVHPGSPPSTSPAIMFGPDGFISNDSTDFAMVGSNQDIQLRFINRRSNGMTEGRVLSIDRAGNVSLTPYLGS